jgi:hypothetical protein
MKTPIRMVVAAFMMCLALITMSCSSDYPGTSTVYVGVGYGGYGPGWGYGWGGYYAPPPVVIGPPPVAVPY